MSACARLRAFVRPALGRAGRSSTGSTDRAQCPRARHDQPSSCQLNSPPNGSRIGARIGTTCGGGAIRRGRGGSVHQPSCPRLLGAGAAIGFHASIGARGGSQGSSSTPGSRSNLEHPSREWIMHPTAAHATMRDDRSIDLKCRQYQHVVAENMPECWRWAGSPRAPRAGYLSRGVRCSERETCSRRGIDGPLAF